MGLTTTPPGITPAGFLLVSKDHGAETTAIHPLHSP
jgi:hypothetical protein